MIGKRNVSIPDNMVDYYFMYSLDRNLGTKEIRKILLQKQGEIRSNMSNGALNSKEILEKLQEAYNSIAAAVKVFKNDDRRKEYDRALDAAYQAGRIDVAAHTLAQDIYEEIEAMFVKGNYRRAANRCLEALNDGVHDYRIYILLAQSYFAMNDPDNSIKTVESGLQVHPDNIPLLRAGARLSNEGKHDFDRAQRYVNRMMEIDAKNPMSISEQSYLYLNSGKEDLAYKLIDEYVEEHPNDQKFRKDCAYDLIGHSYECYTKDPNGGAYVIASQEDYEKCLETCNKAASLYDDENVQTALNNAKYFGTIEYNDENNEGIFWLFVGGAIYLMPGLVFPLMVGRSDGLEAFFGSLVTSLPFSLVGALLVFSGIRLRQVSFRPYWQINKFILTGKREPGEKKYIIIGKIFAGYIKWCFKVSIWIIKMIFRLMMH